MCRKQKIVPVNLVSTSVLQVEEDLADALCESEDCSTGMWLCT